MFFSVLLFPAAFFDEAFDEQILAGREVDHAAVVVCDERDVRDTADCDSIRDFELAVTEVGSACAKNKGEVVRDMQELTAVHAHTDEKLCVRIGFERAVQVLVLQEASDRRCSILCRNVRDFLDRNKTVHIFVFAPPLFELRVEKTGGRRLGLFSRPGGI